MKRDLLELTGLLLILTVVTVPHFRAQSET
jgi:hypothetical protein